MVLGKLDSHTEKNGTRSLHIPCTKINSKWIKDLMEDLKPQNSQRKHRQHAP